MLKALLPKNWTKEKALSGKYKSCSVQGKGSEYPYNNPRLAINKFEKDNNINFYIDKAGYFQERANTSVKWVFNNEKGVIYSTDNFSFSNDGKTIFFKEFSSPKSSDRIIYYEFLEKLKKASKVSVRISDKYGSNDLSFSLRGSTKAINYVISQEFLNEKIKLIQRLKENKKILAAKQKELEIVEEELKTKRLNKLLGILKIEKLSELSLEGLEWEIEDDLNISRIKLEEIDSILLKPAEDLGELTSRRFEEYGYVDVYYVYKNGVEEKIYGTWQVEMDAPIFQRLKKNTDRIKSIISKYKIEPLKDKIFREILFYNKYSELELNQVENVSIIMSNYVHPYFRNMKIIIHLNNNQKVKMESSIMSLYITKRKLKSIGGKDSVEF